MNKTMSNYRERMEAAIKRRLDAMVEVRKLQEEISLLNDTQDDIAADWRREDNWDFTAWNLSLPKAAHTMNDCYRDWEKENPDWMAVGHGIRKRRKS